MLDWRLPYIAGMIDADGYIAIGRQTKKPSGKRTTVGVYHCLKVGIGGTNRSPHDLAASIFGGNVSSYAPANDKHKIQYQWNTSGDIGYNVLLAIRSYLVVKREQAELGLILQHALRCHWEQMRATQRPPFRITDSMASERNGLWLKMIALNEPRNQRANKNLAVAAGALLDGEVEAVSEIVMPVPYSKQRVCEKYFDELWSITTQPDKVVEPTRFYASSVFTARSSELSIERTFAVIARCQRHTFMLTTDNPERMQMFLRARSWRPTENGYIAVPIGRDTEEDIDYLPNLWLGVEASEVNARMLLETPAAVRFLVKGKEWKILQ